MENIIITGVTGFVGKNLNEYLHHDYSITGVSRKDQDNAEIITYNQMDIGTLNKAKAFIHLAGKAHDLRNISDDNSYFKANTELTKELFDLFLKSTCEIFIYMSSVKAVADKVEGVLEEDFTPEPLTIYGKSKLKAEEYISGLELSSDKRVYILRPCMIHGPENKGNLNLLYKMIEKVGVYPFGAYENSRSFLSVDNLSFIIKNLIENKRIVSGIYNVSDNQSYSTKELVTILAEGANRKVKIVSIPKLFIQMIAKIGDVVPFFPINTERLEKLTENYIVSNKKIAKALGKELPLSGKEGLLKTVSRF